MLVLVVFVVLADFAALVLDVLAVPCRCPCSCSCSCFCFIVVATGVMVVVVCFKAVVIAFFIVVLIVVAVFTVCRAGSLPCSLPCADSSCSYARSPWS